MPLAGPQRMPGGDPLTTSHKTNILLVDDNPDDLTVFRRAVRDKPWNLTAAESGRTGLDKALSQAFDAIVLDYNLGDMTGTEVLLRIKEAGISTPVLIQSGLGSDFIVARALTLGAEGFIPKDSPTYSDDVRTKVEACLARGRAPTWRDERAEPRQALREVEEALDALIDRGQGHLQAVGFASPDGFRVSTRFRKPKALSPETICAMVASATSTCHFLGEGIHLPSLRLVTADYEGGRLFAAPVPDFGVVFAATDQIDQASERAREEVAFAARELTTLLATLSARERNATP